MLAELSQNAINRHGNNTANIIDFIVTNLTETYGAKYINTKQDEWVFNNAGGAMGQSFRSFDQVVLCITKSSRDL